jgi:hypothetical protein
MLCWSIYILFFWNQQKLLLILTTRYKIYQEDKGTSQKQKPGENRTQRQYISGRKTNQQEQQKLKRPKTSQQQNRKKDSYNHRLQVKIFFW